MARAHASMLNAHHVDDYIVTADGDIILDVKDYRKLNDNLYATKEFYAKREERYERECEDDSSHLDVLLKYLVTKSLKKSMSFKEVIQGSDFVCDLGALEQIGLADEVNRLTHNNEWTMVFERWNGIIFVQQKFAEEETKERESMAERRMENAHKRRTFKERMVQSGQHSNDYNHRKVMLSTISKKKINNIGKNNGVKLLYCGEIDAVDSNGNFVELKMQPCKDTDRKLHWCMHSKLLKTSYILAGFKSGRRIDETKKIPLHQLRNKKFNSTRCFKKLRKIFNRVKNLLEKSSACLVTYKDGYLQYDSISCEEAAVVPEYFKKHFMDRNKDSRKSFPLAGLDPVLPEKINTELDRKSYFRMRKTCPGMDESIRKSKTISIHMKNMPRFKKHDSAKISVDMKSKDVTDPESCLKSVSTVFNANQVDDYIVSDVGDFPSISIGDIILDSKNYRKLKEDLVNSKGLHLDLQKGFKGKCEDNVLYNYLDVFLKYLVAKSRKDSMSLEEVTQEAEFVCELGALEKIGLAALPGKHPCKNKWIIAFERWNDIIFMQKKFTEEETKGHEALTENQKLDIYMGKRFKKYMVHQDQHNHDYNNRKVMISTLSDKYSNSAIKLIYCGEIDAVDSDGNFVGFEMRPTSNRSPPKLQWWLHSTLLKTNYVIAGIAKGATLLQTKKIGIDELKKNTCQTFRFLNLLDFLHHMKTFLDNNSACLVSWQNGLLKYDSISCEEAAVVPGYFKKHFMAQNNEKH